MTLRQPPAQVVNRKPTNENKLVPGSASANSPHVPPGYPEAFGEDSQQGVVGLSLLRRRGHPDLENILTKANYLAPGCLRLDLYPNARSGRHQRIYDPHYQQNGACPAPRVIRPNLYRCRPGFLRFFARRKAG